MKALPMAIVLLTSVGLTLPAHAEPAKADTAQTATAALQSAGADTLSLEQIRARVGPLDVFHPMDGELPSFDELAKLVDGIKAAVAKATDPESKGELALAHLRALQMALSALPVEPEKLAAEPYASWLKAQGEQVFQDEISGSWMVPVNEYWTLADQYKDAAVGDALAFHAASALMGGECEGMMSCNSFASLGAEGEYLKRFPKGKFTGQALDLVTVTLDGMLTEWDNQPEEQAEASKTLAEWETILMPQEDSELAKKAKESLKELQARPVAASTAGADGLPPVAGGMSTADTQDAEVQKAAEFAAKQMGQELDNVVEASQQVVAGMNYAMTIKLKNGEIWVVTVYKDLQGNYSLSESARQ